MLKKIILGVIVVALLVGSESVLANKKGVGAGAKQKQMKKPRGQIKRKQQGLRPGGKRAGQQEFDRYFNALVKAYRENDREKMGQMLRKINQIRQRQQKAKVVPGERRRDLPKGRGLGKRRRGRFRSDLGRAEPGFWHRGMGRRGPGFRRRGAGRRGRGFYCRGIGRPGPEMPPGEMDRLGPDMPRRGMGGHGRGLQGKGIGREGRGMGGGHGQGLRGRGGREGRGIPHRNINVRRRNDMSREDFDWDW